MKVLPSRGLRVVGVCFFTAASMTWLIGCAPPVKHVPLIVRATPISLTQPRYPPQAVRERHQGTVIVLVTVDAHGFPADIQIAQSSGFQELDRAAVAGISQWVYKPETADGVPRVSTVKVPINFDLVSFTPQTVGSAHPQSDSASPPSPPSPPQG